MAIDDKNIDTRAIADYIVSKNILDKKTINEALQNHLLKKIETGFAIYSITNHGISISIKNEKGEVEKSLDLPVSKENIKPITFSDNSILIIDEDNLNSKSFIKRNEANGFSLSIKGGQLKNKNINYSLNKWFGEINSKDSSAPLDIHFFEKLPNYIFFSDRKLGKIFIVQSNLQSIVKELKINKKDNGKAINIVYSPKIKKCYITDYQSPEIFSINMDNYTLEKFNPALGNLGNLVISKDEKSLYILVPGLSKTADLLNVTIQNFKMIKKVHLKGKILSEHGDPLDILSISPSGKKIFAVTQDNNKIILNTVILEPTETIVDSEPLTQKPLGIAIKANYNLPDIIPSFSNFLVEKKLMHESSMQNVINDLKGNVKTKKETKQDVLLDQDVANIQSKIEENIKGNEKALNDLLEPTEKDVNKLLSDTGIDWQGRKMSKEDKDSLVKGMSSIKATSEVSKTNGVFVLSWMNDLLEP
jgi:hypothetical protein